MLVWICRKALRDKGSTETLALLKGERLRVQFWQSLSGDVKTCLRVPANQTKVKLVRIEI